MPAPKHKRKFVLVQSSSAPWGEILFGRPPHSKVDLTDFSFQSTGPVDGLRVGLNSAAAYKIPDDFDFGFEVAMRQKKTTGDGTTIPEYRAWQQGYGFGIGWFLPNGEWISATTREIHLNEAGGAPGVPLTYPLGIPNNAPYQNQNSITGQFKTRQTFFISTPVGPDGLANAHIPDAPNYWKFSGSWHQVCLDFFNHKTYYDLSLTMDLPYRREEFDKKYAAHVYEPFIEFTPTYNFYVKEYEDGITKYDEDNPTQPLPSYMLPSIYMFASEADESFLDPQNRVPFAESYQHSTLFYKHIALDAGHLPPQIKTTYQDIILTDPMTGMPKKVGEKDTGQHFQNFGTVIGNVSPAFTSSFNEYKNMVFPRDNLNLLDNFSGKETYFPMAINVEFATDVGTPFADFLRDAKLTSVLTKWLVTGSSDAYFKNWAQYDFPVDVGSGGALRGDSQEESLEAGLELASFYGFHYQNPRVWDFGKFMDGLLFGSNKQTLTDEWQTILEPDWNGMFLGKHREEVQAAVQPGSEYALFIQLMMYVFKHNSEGFVGEKFREFEDLLKNDHGTQLKPRKNAYSETLLYCLEKTALRNLGNNNFVTSSDTQKIWFPNSSDIGIIKYVDTQVKYNTPYQYVLKAYQLVVGNKYSYEINLATPRPGTAEPPPPPTGGSNDSNLWHHLCVFNEPCLKIIEIPIYNSRIDNPFGIMVDDTRPVPPDVQIIPFRGVDDQILIWLNGTVGDFMAMPVKILPGDYPDITDFQIPIRFKSDDPSTSFEIFRLDKRPISYEDFSSATRITIGSNDAPAKSYIDKEIKPNKKYYYTFRTTDVHGKTSNPTVVYECQLVKTDEFVHAEVQTIDMEEYVDLQVMKPFKKFLQIKPAYSQTILDTNQLREYARNFDPDDTTTYGVNDIETSGLQDKLRFETPGQSIWNTGNSTGKKYKIRLHSKKSGRKIDFNIDFTFDENLQYLLGKDES